jgi:hypothetical protein
MHAVSYQTHILNVLELHRQQLTSEQVTEVTTAQLHVRKLLLVLDRTTLTVGEVRSHKSVYGSDDVSVLLSTDFTNMASVTVSVTSGASFSMTLDNVFTLTGNLYQKAIPILNINAGFIYAGSIKINLSGIATAISR